MNLQELGAKRPTQQIAKVIESQSGQKINFDLIGPRRARGMLSRVQSTLHEHRNSPNFHKSQASPAYLNLVMMEQALSARIQEADMAPLPTAGTAPAVNPAQMGMQIAQRKKQLQDQLKAAQEQVRAIQKQMSQPSLGMAESRQRISESELQQAQVVLAAQDMIDRMQKMLEEISEMQFKDLPALTDSIKNDMGADQAMQFQSTATASLTQLLTAVQASKTEMEGAQAVLTGQSQAIPGAAPVVPGADPLAAQPDDEQVDIDADVDVDATLPADDEEDDVPSAGLGRERR